MKSLLPILLLVSLFSCKKTVEVKTDNKTEVVTESQLQQYITSRMEYAYFEGQRDFIQGTQRIDYTINDNGDTCWHWTQSPWDGSTKQPIYQPPCK